MYWGIILFVLLIFSGSVVEVCLILKFNEYGGDSIQLGRKEPHVRWYDML